MMNIDEIFEYCQGTCYEKIPRIDIYSDKQIVHRRHKI